MFQAFDGASPGSGLEHGYNANGYLTTAEEAKNSAETTGIYYQITARDHRGNVTQMVKQGATVNRAFDAVTGRATGISAENAGFETLQDLTLSFDVLGNLTEKRDQSGLAGGGFKDIIETYGYDGLNRLTSVTQDGTTRRCR